MSVIYSLVARQNMVLCDHSPHQGNFSQVALDLLPRVSLNSKYGRFATNNHCFYVLTKDKFVFLVLVEQSYEMYIAVKFLEKIRDEFFSKYEAKKRNAAGAHSLKDFRRTLETWMGKYNNKEEVDKLYMLRKELREVEEQALINMNLTILRGQDIEILVNKSKDMADISYTLKETSGKVRDKIWWKSKKLLLGICTVVVVVVLVVVLIAVL